MHNWNTSRRKNQAEVFEVKMAEDKRRSDIEYIDRLVRLGQEESVKHFPQYQTWLEWKKALNKKTAD